MCMYNRYLFDPNFIPEVALIIDPFASKCILHDPQTEKHQVIKIKPLRDSHLSQDVIHIINYLTLNQNCIIKWVIAIGDLNKLQKHEIETSIEQMNEYRSVYFVEKSDGHMLFLLSQLGTTFSPNENVGIVVDHGTSATATLWKLHNGKMVKHREATVPGTGINEGLTVDDLKAMKESLLDGRQCDNWVMEYSESKLVLEKFFDYKIHETFLMVGLGYRSLSMIEKSSYNYLSGGLYYSQMILNKCCHSTIIIGKDIIDESTINVEKGKSSSSSTTTSNANCVIL
uniref:Actin-like protein n=1 Tax=Panagrolaimus sp. ES5 TaxID=591445 RepID=A0AC34FIA5_9BILA